MKKMAGTELLEEVEWLLDGGMHPVYICEVLQKRPSSIYQAAYRHNNQLIAIKFSAEENRERGRKTANGHR